MGCGDVDQQHSVALNSGQQFLFFQILCRNTFRAVDLSLVTDVRWKNMKKICELLKKLDLNYIGMDVCFKLCKGVDKFMFL